MIGLGLHTQTPKGLGEYYSGFPGAKLLESTANFCELTFGRTKIAFETADESTSPFYYWMIQVVQNRFNQVVANLPSNSEILTDKRVEGLVRIGDPAGNIVDLRAVSGDVSQTEELLGVSRLGLVTDDLARDLQLFADHLEDALGSLERGKQSLRSTIDGSEFLFIPHGAKMHPSGRVAGIYPLTVSIHGPRYATMTVEHLPYYVYTSSSAVP
jgi:hypothetical protein